MAVGHPATVEISLDEPTPAKVPTQLQYHPSDWRVVRPVHDRCRNSDARSSAEMASTSKISGDRKRRHERSNR